MGCVKVSGVVEARCWVRSQTHASLAARFCLFKLGAAGRWQVLLASAVAMGALRLALEASDGDAAEAGLLSQMLGALDTGFETDFYSDNVV